MSVHRGVERRAGVRVVLAAVVLTGVVSALSGTAGAASTPTTHGALTQVGFPSHTVVPGSDVAIASSPDGKSIYALDRDGLLSVLGRNTQTGVLTQAGCFSFDGVNPYGGTCIQVNGLAGAAAVTVSPDNKNVYVASRDRNALLVFNRATVNGALTPAGCFASLAANGCSTAPGLGNADDVAVTDDGKSVFVSGGGGTLAIFARSTQGTDPLTATGCLREGDGAGCAQGRGLGGAAGVAVSHDGKSVYVAGGNTIAVFSRNPSTLALTQDPGTAGCVASGENADNCGSGGSALGGAGHLLVTRDNKSVYVVATGTSAVLGFTRSTTTGELNPATCLSSVATAGCTATTAMGGPLGITQSNDGKSVYVATDGNGGVYGNGAIVDLARTAATSTLAEKDCVAETLSGCTPVYGLGGISGVTVIANSVYGAGDGGVDSGISEFVRTSTGALTGKLQQQGQPAQGCYSTYYGGSVDCQDLGLGSAQHVIVTADNKSVFVTGAIDQISQFDQLVEFKRNTATGLLTRVGCVGNPICSQGVLYPISTVVASPDSKNVYVGERRSTQDPNGDELPAIGIYTRTSAGTLSPTGCYASVPGCSGRGFGGDQQPDNLSLAMSKDGHSLYAGTNTGIVQFSRNASTGALTYVGCQDSSDVTCTHNDFLRGGVRAVTVSPDGKSAYVLSDNQLGARVPLIFARNTTTGVLTYQGCVASANDYHPGCVEAGALPDAATNIAFSPDSKTVYITGHPAGSTPGISVAGFARNTSTGTITGLAPGTWSQAFGESDLVTVSADGKSVYVEGYNFENGNRLNEPSINVFTRSTTGTTIGQLTALPGTHSCIDTALSGCTFAHDLSDLGDLALSPDGKSAYTTAPTGLGIFTRQTAA